MNEVIATHFERVSSTTIFLGDSLVIIFIFNSRDITLAFQIVLKKEKEEFQLWIELRNCHHELPCQVKGKHPQGKLLAFFCLQFLGHLENLTIGSEWKGNMHSKEIF